MKQKKTNPIEERGEPVRAPDCYAVVCHNGFLRGYLVLPGAPMPKTLQELHRCARLRNEMCACGSQSHRIVRLVQVGTGAVIE